MFRTIDQYPVLPPMKNFNQSAVRTVRMFKFFPPAHLGMLHLYSPREKQKIVHSALIILRSICVHAAHAGVGAHCQEDDIHGKLQQ